MATSLTNTVASVPVANVGQDGIVSAASGKKWGTYGATPVVQRASAVQAASVVSATSYISVTSNLAAFCAEVAATMTALGIWKGTA
jgi:hypothetical protein